MSFPVRPLALDRGDLVALVREAVASGAGLWVQVNGSSMAPAIPAGSAVHLAPLRGGGPRRGDVVLTVRESGSPMLHRVRRVRGHQVDLKGDNLFQADHPFDLSSVIAMADSVMIDGRPVPMDARPRASVLTMLRQLRRRLLTALTGR